MKRFCFFIVGLGFCCVANAQSQLVTGTNIAVKGKSIEFLPVTKKAPATEMLQKAAEKKTVDTKFVEKVGTKNLYRPFPPIEKVNVFTTLSNVNHGLASPLNGIDTVIMQTANQSHGIVKTNFKGQTITGVLVPAKGKEILIVPAVPAPSEKENKIADNANAVASNLNMLAPLPAVIGPMDLLDTNAMINTDPMKAYGVPSRLNLKAQDIKKGTYTATKGSPTLLIPIPKDSIIIEPSDVLTGKQNAAIDTNYTPAYTFVNSNNANTNKAETNDNNTPEYNFSSTGKTAPIEKAVPAAVPAPATNTYLRTTFYVSQEGKYSVAFTGTEFYVTITNEGKLVDYGITTNGAVINDYSRQVSKVGNISVVRNYKGNLDNIGDVHLAYTYDGKINRIGNLQITYNRDGLMERVGNIFVEYNYNNTVDKIANYRIGYKHRQVIGIDDSDGLVVFKPSIQN
jgi:hypothetical protein